MTEPSTYALLAAGSYQDIRKKDFNQAPLPPGWTELTEYAIKGSGSAATYTSSAFSASVYQGPGGEIVISYAGTEFNPGSAGMNMDFLAGNMPLALGLFSPQAMAAADLYQRVLADRGNNITFTGHSLGGGLAAMMAVCFDRPAKVFAPAPFRAAVDNDQYLLGILGVLAPIRARLFLNGQLDPHLGGIPDALASYSPVVDYNTRQSNVQVWAVKGEVLEKVLSFLPVRWIELSRNPLLNAGSTELDMTSKHSIELHAAGLLSTTFNEWAAKLPTALPLIFDKSLYGYGPASAQQDFLMGLLRKQVGVAGTAPNAMLTHYANDLQKLGTNVAGLTRAAQDALIAQGIEWYYWQGTDYAGQEFFTQTGTLLQYTSAQGAALPGAQNKAALYVSAWLDPIVRAETSFNIGYKFEQWNVVAGIAGATATALNAAKLKVGPMHLACDLITLRSASGLLRHPLLCLPTQRMTTKTNHKQVNFTQPCRRTRRASVPARLRARGLGACTTRSGSRQHLGLHTNSAATANWRRRSGTATRHVCGLDWQGGKNKRDRQVHSMRVAGMKVPGWRMDSASATPGNEALQ